MGSDEPVARRPNFPAGYGIAAGEDGLLAWSWVEERLEAARNYWIATAGANGAPHAMPVWALWIDGAIIFSSSPESRKGRNLAHDPRVVVHLESGDEVVVIEGEAEQTELDERVAVAYEKKYDFRPEPGSPEGLWLRVQPRVAYGWLERDYPGTATRFVFV